MARIFLFVLFIVAASAPAELIAGDSVDSASEIRRALGAQKGDDLVVISAGEYDIGEIKIRRSLTIIGAGEVVFYSSGDVEKGLLNPLPGVSMRIENITLKGARSPDLNGAGIRHDGAHLTVIGCNFIGNENGILSTGSDTGKIGVHGSNFVNNGHGDGYSHGIYAVRGASLEVFASRFTGTKIGHHIKSLTEKTEIRLSVLDDAAGRSSYAVDVSKGGDVIISDNTIIQSVDGDNATIINYDLSRGGDPAGLKIVNNHIINYHANGALLRKDAPLAPEINGNVIVNQGRGKLAIP